MSGCLITIAGKENFFFCHIVKFLIFLFLGDASVFQSLTSFVPNMAKGFAVHKRIAEDDL